MKRFRIFVVWLLVATCNLVIANVSPEFAYAQDKEELEKCICEAKAKDSADNCLDKLKQSYLQDNKYSEFIGLLRNLCSTNKSIAPSLSYYIALSRYQELKYLEETKSWDEYFAKGNDYRDDIVKETGKSIEATAKDDPIHIYSRLLVYQLHKDQQDAFAEGALSDLMSSVLDYAKLIGQKAMVWPPIAEAIGQKAMVRLPIAEANKDTKPLKEIADKLFFYDEKAKAKELYKVYAEGLLSLDVKDESLKDIAAGFYKDGNLELAQDIYDLYIERISKTLPKDKLASELADIALAFSYKESGFKDMFYAEKIFKKIEDTAGIEAFNEELIYLRGFNLEKDKEYQQAKNVYLLLMQKYPESKHIDEVIYKTGLIFTYVLRDAKTGREYFDKLADKAGTNPYSLSSLYQMGLLKQWEADMAAAKGYYNKLIEKSEGNITDTFQMAQERLKEISGGMPIEYNLKTFMDTSLKEEFANLDMSKVDLKSNIYQPKVDQAADINSSTNLSSSGCFNVELQYLWSCDLGDAKPGVNQSGFKTAYKNQGTKMIGLVLVSPSGITGRSLDFIDAR